MRPKNAALSLLLFLAPVSAWAGGLCEQTIEEFEILENSAGVAEGVRVSGIWYLGGPFEVALVQPSEPNQLTLELRVSGGPNIPITFDETREFGNIAGGLYVLDVEIVSMPGSPDEERWLCQQVPVRVGGIGVPSTGPAGLATLALILSILILQRLRAANA